MKTTAKICQYFNSQVNELWWSNKISKPSYKNKIDNQKKKMPKIG